MNTLKIELGERSYPVLVGNGLLQQAEAWRQLVPDTPLVVFTNDRVAPLYLDTLLAALPGREVHTLVFPDGEAEKSLRNFERAIGFLAERGIRRDACLLALGGGVIGDLCGFVAASWMRGIRFVQFPTTLLAQVDASVGGKTAINIPAGKNLVGAFHQPSLVVADTATLKTLERREYLAGLAEVVKCGAIRDAEFLNELEAGSAALLEGDPDFLVGVVSRAVANKAEVVAEDEFEAGVRATLNFGHSFGHAIETHTGYRGYLHGEAVSIGMVMAARLSEARGLCPAGTADRLAAILQRLDLPVTIPPDIKAGDLLGLMKLDKKNTSRTRRLVLLKALGEALIDTDSDQDEILQAIEACRQPGNQEL
jgi:3-dehydroquinate synthase